MLGALSWISLEEEATWGTSPGSPGADGYARIHGESITNDKGIAPITSVLGDVGVNRIVEGFNRIGGDVEPEMLYEGVPWVLTKHGMGDVQTAADSPVTGAHTHVFGLGAASDVLPIGLTVEVKKGDVEAGEVFLYTGGKVSQLVYNFTPEDLLRMAATLVFEDEVAGTAESTATPTYAADAPVYWFHAGTLTLAGSALPFKSGTLTINNNIADDRFNFARTISEPVRNGKRQVTGSVVAEFADLTLYDKYTAFTSGAFSLTFTSEIFIVGSTPYSVAFSCPDVYITGSTPVVNTEGIIEATFDFVARDNGGGTGEMTLTVTNGETSIP